MFDQPRRRRALARSPAELSRLSALRDSSVSFSAFPDDSRCLFADDVPGGGWSCMADVVLFPSR